MQMYRARYLLTLSIDELMQLPMCDGNVVYFDDGELTASTEEIIFSAILWDIQKDYPHAPLLTRHFIQEVLTGATHNKILANIIFDTRAAYIEKGIGFSEVDMENISRYAFIGFNKLFNFTSTECEEWVGSTCALDFVEAVKHPKIAAANAKFQAIPKVTKRDMDECTAAISEVILKDPVLRHNGLSKALRHEVVALNQTLQCVGPRGFVTDIDSELFPDAVRMGFVHGLTQLADSMMESRSASQSTLFSKGPMQDSEYFNRCEQLAASTIHYIHNSDCGSRNYMPVTISSFALLADLEGAYYLNEETEQEEYLTRKHTHLIGKTIKKRTVLTCIHPNPYEVCARCFGELAVSIPRKTNIGYTAAAQLQGPVGQLILSNKHYLGSASVDPIIISDYDAQFISLGTDENCIYINRRLANSHLFIAFEEKEAPNLIDVIHTDHAATLSPFRISEVRYMQFTVRSNDGETSNLVDVHTETRVGALSRDFLLYIKSNGYEITDNEKRDKNVYRVDMSNWDYDKPIIQMPLKHFNTVDYMKSIESFIKGGSKRNAKSLTAYDTPYGALIALHDLVSLRLSVNVAYLEIIILATLVKSRKYQDYSLPTDRANGESARYNMIMALHSLASALAHEGQEEVIYSPESFIYKVRPRHPLDNLVLG